MPWQLAVACSVLAAVISNLVQRSYSRQSKLPSTLPPALSYVFGVTPIGLIAGFFLFPHHITWSRQLVLLLVIEGFAMALANWLSFIALMQLPLAVSQTIGRFSSVIVITFGWLLLHESLSAHQSLGALLLFVSTLLAIFAPQRQIADLKHRQIHARAVMLMVISSTALGITLLTEKVLLKHMDIGGVYIVGWLVQTLAMVCLASKDLSRKVIKQVTAHELGYSMAMGISCGLVGVFYVYAIYHANNITLVNSVSAVGFPLTILSAYIVLRERENPKLLFTALGIAFLGLFLTTMQ